MTIVNLTKADGTSEEVELSDEQMKQLASFQKSLEVSKGNYSKVFSKMGKGHNKEVRVTKDCYRGKEYYSVREYWCTEDDPEYKPGKGVAFDWEHIDTLIEGLTKARDEE